MKVWVVAIAVVFFASSSAGCGQTASRAAEHYSRAAENNLDRVIPRLPSGLTTGEVEERLGEPAAKFEAEHSEVVLNYRLWQLVFRPSLYKRTRRYPVGERRDQSVAALDRKIRALKLGSSRKTVEGKLGKTETWQVLDFGTNERVWYGHGRWKLHFTDRRLAGKVQYNSP